MNIPFITRVFLGIAIFTSYTLFALSWKASDIIITNLGFDANDLSSLVGIMNLVKVAANLLIGIAVAKFIKEKLFIATSTMMILGSLCVATSLFMLTQISTFELIAAARTIQGIGGAFILFSMNPIVAETFKENDLPIVNGMNGSAFNIGIAIMLTLTSLMATHSTEILHVLIFMSLLTPCLFWFFNRNSVNHMKKEMAKRSSAVSDSKKDDADSYGLVDAFKSSFNWLFAVAFTGIMAFYYVAFTFLDADTVAYMLYTGIVGNLVGIVCAKKFKLTTLVRISAVIAFALAIAFMFTMGQPIGKIMAIGLGFMMFFALPSYLTLPYVQKGATAKSIGLTFMILWVLSDLLATFILKFYAYLASSPETNYAATMFILVIKSMFLIGCFLFKTGDK